MISITVVRHGSTAWSDAGRLCGSTDVPLLPEAEAGLLRKRDEFMKLLGSGADSVNAFTSPSVRCISTSKALGFPNALVDPRLRERGFGELEGLTRAAAERDLGIVDIWASSPVGGETTAETAQRVRDFVHRYRILTTLQFFSRSSAPADGCNALFRRLASREEFDS